MSRRIKRVGNAKYFYGTSGNYIDTTFTKNYGATDQFTFEGYFRTPGKGAEERSIFGSIYEAGANDPSIRVNIDTDGLINAFVRDDSGNVPGNVKSTTRVDDGKWHHFALVRNVSLDKMQLYCDGVLEANVTDTTTTINIATSMLIGAHNNRGTPDTHFLGAIDEIRFSSIARYTAEFSVADYKNTPFTNDGYTDLLLHFEEATTPIDSSTTPKTLTVTGTVGNCVGYVGYASINRTAA